MTSLVVVESPAKAKTIAGYLGSKYDVQASFGHVRDLPERADEVPAEYKKFKWAKLGVNVDSNFEPLYVVPENKKKHVEMLRRAAKSADEVLLATDEDREGESISWHIVQLLHPGKKTRVRRIVFHEVTPEAIKEAINSPRDIDENLVRAQETRRILDRLYGYTLSPVLWKKVAPKLSAGRVQSVAVKLLVERERERKRFRSASYWDLESDLLAGAEKPFRAKLIAIGDRRIAIGKNFDATTGELADKDVLLLDGDRAKRLAELAQGATPWTVSKLEARPEVERPPVPFMTSTLQQEANRKLRFSSKRTMQIAQQLYEGVELGRGERVGLITYMRTDSLSLSERALTQAREVISDLYGKEYLPAEAQRYRTKSKNAQEAHEAIRPTDLSRRPEDVKSVLDGDAFRLYELIWKRTIACQMVAARVERTSVQVEVSVDGSTLRFSASGKQITFPGFLRAYVEGSDDPEAELGGQESLLPELRDGMVLSPKTVTPLEHTTKPPARLTEATLVKRLEELGVGRPSTYASIISTIQDRGYVFKHGNELVPTFTAFAVTELLEKHFAEFVDVRFTARMEDELDEIAEGKRDYIKHLATFYKGESSHPGLLEQVEKETPTIDFPKIQLGNDTNGNALVVRVGRFGTFVQRGEGGKENTVSIPEDTLPADLKVDRVLELLRIKAMGPVAVAKDAATGRDVFLRSGRFGSYFELAQTADEVEREEKPRRVSVPSDMDPKQGIDPADVALLLAFPRELGRHPETSDVITANLGRYGAYIRHGADTRNIPSWRDAASLTLAQALEVLKLPKMRRGKASVVRTPLKEFARDGAVPLRVFEGKYGQYVTDGTTNATLPRGTPIDELTIEQALDLIRAREGMPKKGRRVARRGAAASKQKPAPEAKPAKKKSVAKRPATASRKAPTSSP